jgi:branched-chain amino acid transport system permease protein
VSLGHIAYYGVGAYAYAFVASPHFGVHLPFPAALIIDASPAPLPSAEFPSELQAPTSSFP